MDQDTWVAFLLVLAFILIGGLFAGTELALVSLRESQIARLERQGHRGARVAAVARDPNRFLAEHLDDNALDLVETAPDRRPALPREQVVGHVHLKVGQTAAAKEFYVDALGFEVTAEMPGALFVSAGGYHHHMAMNTWTSQGVGLRAPALGLGLVAIEVPTMDDVSAAADRLRAKGLRVRADQGAIEVDDPWVNLVRIAAKAG